MFPYKTSFNLDRKGSQPLYIQLSNQFIQLIKEQKLLANTKLPGTRTLADLLDVHRKTIVSCYEELLLQGWVESIPKKGTFVHSKLPEFTPIKISTVIKNAAPSELFEFKKDTLLDRKLIKAEKGIMSIDDGISDTRLTPVEEIARTYRRIASRKNIFEHLSYGSLYGNEKLRNTLVEYLNNTRGLSTNKENILITRGSQNGIYLAAQLLIENGDFVVVGTTNYVSADITFQQAGASLIRVNVDQEGLVISDLEKICKEKKIKAIYVTSHHHHPTTVTLSAERRIHLLNLAKEHGFAIIEDDYDYDFNYNHAPILPLASHDIHGNVIYIGSVCKTVAPVFRIGYLIAHEKFVSQAAKLRRIIDRQGDALLELTFADFIQSGALDAHIRKILKIYKNRRDVFCNLLEKELNDFFEFKTPKGGMAVWLKLKTPYNWKDLALEARKEQLEIGDFERYDEAKTGHNSIRVGFASYNEKEIYELVNRLKKTMKIMSN